MTRQRTSKMTSQADVPVRVLIINPNTSQHMTDALKPVVEGLGYKNVSHPSISLIAPLQYLLHMPT